MRLTGQRSFPIDAAGFFTALLTSLAPPALGQQIGSVEAWGGNNYGQVTVPITSLEFIAVAAGDAHSLGLLADGSVVAWGWNLRGECDVPMPNANFVAISAGERHSLGLKSDGSIVAWGDNDQGQCNVPAPNSGFVATVAGDYHSLGLKADGSILAWGENFYGECELPAPNTDFVAVTAGRAASFGLKADGSIVAWGWNTHGQCNVPAPNASFVAVASKGYHCLGLKSDGSIVAWGNNSFGQCEIPEPNTGFIALSAGYWHSLGLRADGSIVGWGRNDYGQCDAPVPNTGFVAISGGWIHTLGLRVQNRPPVAVCSSDCEVNCEATGSYGRLITLSAAGSYDADGHPLAYHWDVSDLDVILDNPDSPTPSGIFPIGVTMATLTVADGCGGVDTCDVTVTVRDTTPPEVMCTSDIASLWSPDHTLRTVRLLVVATDDATNPGDFQLVRVTIRSDEPDDAAGNGDGATTGDVDESDGFAAPVDRTARFAFDPQIAPNGAWVATVQLRAERAGGGDGRCYTIDVTARDSHGNTATTSCCIVVPHDRRGTQ